MRENVTSVIVEPAFELFSRAHLVTLLLIFGVSLVLPLWARGWQPKRIQAFAVWLAIALVAYRTAYTPITAWLYGESWLDLLPLHVCGILFYICAFALWKRSQVAFEIAYFWGMGGALQALLTPEIRTPFPHPTFFSHFAGHGALMVAIFYTVMAMRMRPARASIPRALAATLAYAALLLPLNLLLGTNYMYLLAKPSTASLLDYLGPWPWYILPAIGVALVSYLVWYLPFLVIDLARGSTRPRPPSPATP